MRPSSYQGESGEGSQARGVEKRDNREVFIVGGSDKLLGRPILFVNVHVGHWYCRRMETSEIYLKIPLIGTGAGIN